MRWILSDWVGCRSWWVSGSPPSSRWGFLSARTRNSRQPCNRRKMYTGIWDESRTGQPLPKIERPRMWRPIRLPMSPVFPFLHSCFHQTLFHCTDFVTSQLWIIKPSLGRPLILSIIHFESAQVDLTLRQRKISFYLGTDITYHYFCIGNAVLLFRQLCVSFYSFFSTQRVLHIPF